MSIESVMSRIAAIQGGLATPPAAATGPQTASIKAAGPGATSFASSLQSTMGTSGDQTFPAAAPGTYPHLDGDLDSNPELLQRLEALAAQRGEHFHITSGGRSYAEQERLWNARGSNPYPFAHPGTSRHETGRAADVTINGRAIQDVISGGELQAAGLSPLAGDAVHVELPA
jgi:D-alanyl-D-alanine carboxypeptidase